MKTQLAIHYHSARLYRRPASSQSESGVLRTLYAFYAEFLAVLDDAFGGPEERDRLFGYAYPRIDSRTCSYRDWAQRFLRATLRKANAEKPTEDFGGAVRGRVGRNGGRGRGRSFGDRPAPDLDEILDDFESSSENEEDYGW
jgi:hypothetical protein